MQIDHYSKELGKFEERSKLLALLTESRYLEDFKEKVTKYIKEEEEEGKKDAQERLHG